MLRDMISQLEKSVMGNIAKMYYQFMGELNRMLARVDDLHEDVAPCKRALATISAGNTSKVRRIEVPKPKSFNGLCNAEEVDNFLWRIKQNLVCWVDEEAVIQFVAFYLTNITKLC